MLGCAVELATVYSVGARPTCLAKTLNLACSFLTYFDFKLVIEVEYLGKSFETRTFSSLKFLTDIENFCHKSSY